MGGPNGCRASESISAIGKPLTHFQAADGEVAATILDVPMPDCKAMHACTRPKGLPCKKCSVTHKQRCVLTQRVKGVEHLDENQD